MARTYLQLGLSTALLPLLVSGCFAPSDSGGAPPAMTKGSSYKGGIITSRFDGNGCTRIKYELPPAWNCDEATLEQLNESLSPYASDNAYLSAPVDVSDVDSVPQLEQGACADLVDSRKIAIAHAATEQLDQQVASALRHCESTEDVDYYKAGVEVSYCSTRSYEYDAAGSDSIVAATGGSSTQQEGASTYSTTNNQVASVEEADYVKNDSGHVFVVTDLGVRVFDTWPVEDAKQLAIIPIEGNGRRLLLAENRLIVLSQTDVYSASAASEQGCTYGYSCRAQAEAGGTRLAIWDVTDPSQPKAERSEYFPSGFLAARRIDNAVHLVLQQGSTANYPLGLDYTPEADSLAALISWRTERSKLIADTVDALSETDLLPHDCDEALLGAGANGLSILSVSTIDITGKLPTHHAMIASQPGYVYASEDALYVATDGTNPGQSYYYYASAEQEMSLVHKFNLSAQGPDYRGTAGIRGHVLNQFAMDEKDGILRVASTNGWVPDPDVSSNITTLQEYSGHLGRLGELTGIAPTEDIRSVRFDGDRGFVVTFKKTDPLFVIDMSVPATPKITGELKIPGFSTYMHPLDEDHILAVGFDAEDQGSFAYFQGIQIQMFDVSNLSSPQLLHKLVLGGRGSASEALMNHLAFNYFPSRKMLAMPVSLCSDSSGGGNYSETLEFSGVLALSIDIDAGIKEAGRLPFADAALSYNYGGYGCYNWWSSSTSSVKRSIFFDDYLFGLSDTEMRAAHLDDLSDVLVTLPLVEGSTAPVLEYDFWR